MSARFQHNPGTASRRARQASQASTYSVYSTVAPTCMSGTSSEHVLDTLDTPVDECFPASVSSGRKQPPRFDAYGGGGTTVGEVSRRHAGDSPLSVLNQQTAAALERPVIECRRSTRELISKFEAISGRRGTPPATARPAHRSLLTPPVPPSFHRRNSPLPDLPLPTKVKSQAPFSFRNLLTVFGKKNKSPKPTQPETSVSVTKPAVPPTDDVFFSSPLSSHAGSALYLSASTHPPTWRPCSLTLHPSHLALTFSEDARHITRTIPLLYCADVASLASHQLGCEIPTPSMGGDQGMEKVAHVFEMTFEGCEPAKERLAAWSVAERSRWVSATWDAILACRDPNTFKNDVRVASPNDIIRGPPLKVVNGASQPSSSSSSPSLAAPRPVPSEHVQIQDAVGPPSGVSVPTTPTRPPRLDPSSEPSSAPSTLPSSSSIQTLGTMSIVRQRLAKLDAQNCSPYAHSLTRGISSSGSYVASSMKRRAPGIDQGGQRDSPVNTSKISESLGRNGTINTRFNTDGAQETSFTALDAHAMYYEAPLDLVGTDISDPSGQNRINKEGLQPLGGTMRLDTNRSLTRPTEGLENLERDISSLLTSFHQHAAEQSSQASGLVERFISLDEGVETIVANVKALPRGINEVDLAPVHAKLDQIKDEIAAFDVGTMRALFEEAAFASQARVDNTMANGSSSSGQPSPRLDLSPVLTKLEELRSLQGGLPLVIQKLEQIDTSGTSSVDLAPVLAKLEDIMGVVNASSETRSSLTDVHTKLDALFALCATVTDKPKDPGDPASTEVVMHNVSRSKDSTEGSEEGSEDNPERNCPDEETNDASPAHEVIADPEQVTKLLAMLEGDQTSREMQAKQQADSVRYLNELNTWLENFVTSSVGNMRHIATGVDQLCKEWLPIAEAQGEADTSDSNTDEGKGPQSPDNAFLALQRFLAEQKEKSGDTRNLQAAIQELTETLKEDMAKNAEARFEMVRHAQIQESLLNRLSAELAKEIRGERLRFVDAMKDATSVNVARHVEELKEVLGRLHHEKTILERQIAELFSFVAKQRQTNPPQPQPEKVTSEVPRPRPRPLPQINGQKSPPGYNVGTMKP